MPKFKNKNCQRPGLWQITCKIIAQKNGLSLKDISYCGLKDTFGITAQRICISNKGKLRYIKFNRHFLKDFQDSDKKLKLRGHKGNHFIVRAKNVSSSPERSRILLQNFKKTIKSRDYLIFIGCSALE